MVYSMASLLWFRNDLRLDDNPALTYALAQGCTQAIFIATPKQWQQHDLAPIKIDFIERHINALAAPLAEIGIHLTILEVDDFTEQNALITDYCVNHQITEIIANSELECNEVARDQALMAQGIKLTLFEADVIVAKGHVLNQQGQMFKVFTPFKKAWLKQLQQTGIQLAPNINSEAVKQIKTFEPYVSFTADKKSSKAWPLASELGSVKQSFFHEKLLDYGKFRDFPAIKGTSGFSPYLAIGAISAKWLVAELLHQVPDLLVNIEHPAFSWLNELIWRDFYRHLLFHFPRLGKHQAFQTKYLTWQWPNNPELLKAWQQGKTGYPLVDAAMQQLLQTGWMHNRLRMVVASFLTKHLLIDWRLGERFFSQHLIDGDLAANNGGWQWAASTGCDAQPYFRIFNPISQSEKFDPNGEFIRKYLPQLADVPNKHIHFPHSYLQGKNHDYWPAVVDHKSARTQALSFYQAKR